MSRSVSSGPWSPPDNHARAVVGALAVLGLLVSWFAVSGEERFIPQLKWVTLGVSALVVGAVADAVWLLVGMRAVRDRRREVVLAGWRVAQTIPVVVADDDGREYVAVERADLYHDPGCQLVRGKQLSTAPAAGHVRRGRRPCPMCVR